MVQNSVKDRYQVIFKHLLLNTDIIRKLNVRTLPSSPAANPEESGSTSGPHCFIKWPSLATRCAGVVTVCDPPQYRLHKCLSVSDL